MLVDVSEIDSGGKSGSRRVDGTATRCPATFRKFNGKGHRDAVVARDGAAEGGKKEGPVSARCLGGGGVERGKR